MAVYTECLEAALRCRGILPTIYEAPQGAVFKTSGRWPLVLRAAELPSGKTAFVDALLAAAVALGAWP